jgi:heme/copper-type cytochrome/quinol oxidase subunit 2
MKKNSIITIVIIIVLILVVVWIYSAMKSGQSSNTLNNPAPQTGQNNTVTPELFSSSPLSQNAYLISTGTYDAATKTALTGFTVTKKTLADGSMEITLNATNPDYQTQTYTVKTGEKLYFIEGLPGDDNGNTDRSMGDDQAILVDVNGYIVTQ